MSENRRIAADYQCGERQRFLADGKHVLDDRYVFWHAVSDFVAAIPVQFATAYAAPRGLHVLDLPFESPSPPIHLYWHSRRTRDPAHAWLRKLVYELCEPFRANYA